MAKKTINPSRDTDDKPSSFVRSRAFWLIVILAYAAHAHYYIWSHEVPKRPDKQRDLSAIRFSDEQHYYRHAAERFSEDGWAYLATEDSLRSPPMPWIWHLLWGQGMILTRAANIGLVLFGAFLIGCIARRFDAQLLATFLTAVSYQVAYYSGTILTEPLAFSFVCFALFAIDRAALQHPWRWIVLAGLFSALAVYSRPSLLPWPLMMLVFTVLSRVLPQRGLDSDDRAMSRLLRANGRGFAVKHALVLLICCVAVLAPWMIKNHIYFNAPRVANGVGAVLYLGSELKTDADEPGFSGMQWPNVAVQGAKGHMSLEGERRLKEAALEKIRAHTGSWVKIMPIKAARFLFGGPRWHFQPGSTFKESKQWQGRTRGTVRFIWWTCFGTLITVYGILGMFGLAVKRDVMGMAGCALLLTLLGVHVVTYSMPRFIVPAWPAVALAAAFAIKNLKPFGHGFAMLSAIAIVLVITLWHEGTASREIPERRMDAFAIAQSVSVNDPSALDVSLDCSGFNPKFNTCVFVSARLHAKNDTPHMVTATLHLIPAEDSKKKPPPPIDLELVVDQEVHHYLQCIELNPAWRHARWKAVELRLPVESNVTIADVTLAVGY